MVDFRNVKFGGRNVKFECRPVDDEFIELISEYAGHMADFADMVPKDASDNARSVYVVFVTQLFLSATARLCYVVKQQNEELSGLRDVLEMAKAVIGERSSELQYNELENCGARSPDSAD